MITADDGFQKVDEARLARRRDRSQGWHGRVRWPELPNINPVRALES